MTADNSSTAPAFPSLQVVAEAYGTSTYSSNSYNAATTTTSPLPPQTGVWLHSPAIDLGILLMLSLVVGTISYTIARLRRKRDR